jgi:plasmid replication initiation protein
MLVQHTENKVARLENKFIFNAHYRLTANEQKIILFLASNIDVTQEDFQKQTIPVVILEKILNQDGKKWGSLYDRMQDFAGRIIGKHISFPTDFEIDGRKFPGYISWFQSIAPCRNSNGEVCLEFEFSNKLKPFLLQLKQYVQLNRIEIAPMKSGFSIRIYSILKAHRDKMRQHEEESTMTYGLDELKSVLGIKGKYAAIDNFKRRVLNVAKKEINHNSSSIKIDIQSIKTNRKITGIKFLITDRIPEKAKDKKTVEETLPNTDSLTKAKLKSYKDLVKFGVLPGIAFHQFIPQIKGGGVAGFEDYFVKYAIQHFKKKSRQKSPGTFVNWWLKGIYSPGSEDWSKIVEQITEAKKQLQIDDTSAYDNRMMAKGMPHAEFKNWYINQVESRD